MNNRVVFVEGRKTRRKKKQEHLMSKYGGDALMPIVSKS
jgi:hypothetical protein